MMSPFIPAAELKQSYDVFGHFYSVELSSQETLECRSVLEIVGKSVTPRSHSDLLRRQPDAVFVMMNPGSSKPLVMVNNRIRAAAIHKLAISLVPTKPDTTQYQVMRLMSVRNWRHVRVLNLSDLRCTKSVEFFRFYRRLEEESQFDSHSVFSNARRDELAKKLTARKGTPLILAWGLSPMLDPLIDRCLLKISGRATNGLLEEGTANKYRHPLPSLQKQKQIWLKQMIRCLRA